MNMHGLTDPRSAAGLRMADAPDLDAIEESLGFLKVYTDLAFDHARLSDLAGLEHDLKRARAHFVFAAKKLRDIQERHDAAKVADVQAEKDARQLAEEFA